MIKDVEEYADLFPANIDKIIANEFKQSARKNENYIEEQEFSEFLDSFFKNYQHFQDLHEKLLEEKFFFVSLPKNETQMNIYDFSKAYKELWILTHSENFQGQLDVDINFD